MRQDFGITKRSRKISEDGDPRSKKRPITIRRGSKKRNTRDNCRKHRIKQKRPLKEIFLRLRKKQFNSWKAQVLFYIVAVMADRKQFRKAVAAIFYEFSPRRAKYTHRTKLRFMLCVFRSCGGLIPSNAAMKQVLPAFRYQ